MWRHSDAEPDNPVVLSLTRRIPLPMSTEFGTEFEAMILEEKPKSLGHDTLWFYRLVQISKLTEPATDYFEKNLLLSTLKVWFGRPLSVKGREAMPPFVNFSILAFDKRPSGADKQN